MPETGLFYNYFRDYDPQTGRYLESDPIGLRGSSFSTYLYTRANPLTYRDATGRCPWCVVGGFVVGVGAYVFGTELGGGKLSFGDALGAGAGGAAAVILAGPAVVAETGALAVGTGRALLGIIGDLGFDLGFNAIDAGGVISSAHSAELSSPLKTKTTCP
jgi:hypothetical protein